MDIIAKPRSQPSRDESNETSNPASLIATGAAVGAAGGSLAVSAYHAWRKQAERTMLDHKPTQLAKIDASALKVDPQAFQFKSGGDDHGVTERLRGVKTWSPMAAGKVMVFERASGERVVADGHQRTGLAHRLMSEGHAPIKMDAIVLRERDGWTPRDVRAYAAIKNMHESSGNALDMAKVMRERPDLVTSSLPVNDTKIREAKALSNLSEDAFKMVASGTVRSDVAAAVGERIKDTTRHLDMMNEMHGAKVTTGQHARLYVGQAMAAPQISETTASLFGEETSQRSLLKERAAVLDKALSALKSDKRIFGLLEREASNIEEVGNKLSHDANAAKAEGAGRLAELVEKLSTTRGNVSDMIDRAARRVAEGETPAKAARALVKDVGDVMKSGGMKALVGGSNDAPRARVHSDEPRMALMTDDNQSSFLPKATTKENLAAASKVQDAKGRVGDPANHGLFGSGSQQTDIVDMAKVIDKRNETAKSHIEVAKATGNTSRLANAADLVARNDRTIAALGKISPSGLDALAKESGLPAGSTIDQVAARVAPVDKAPAGAKVKNIRDGTSLVSDAKPKSVSADLSDPKARQNRFAGIVSNDGKALAPAQAPATKAKAGRSVAAAFERYLTQAADRDVAAAQLKADLKGVRKADMAAALNRLGYADVTDKTATGKMAERLLNNHLIEKSKTTALEGRDTNISRGIGIEAAKANADARLQDDISKMKGSSGKLPDRVLHPSGSGLEIRENGKPVKGADGQTMVFRNREAAERYGVPWSERHNPRAPLVDAPATIAAAQPHGGTKIPPPPAGMTVSPRPLSPMEVAAKQLYGSGKGQPGWSDAARDASAEARGVAKPGEAKTPAPEAANAKPASPAKSPSAKRQAAIEAYVKQHGKTPPARMTIKAMAAATSPAPAAKPFGALVRQPAPMPAAPVAKAATATPTPTSASAPSPVAPVARSTPVIKPILPASPVPQQASSVARSAPMRPLTQFNRVAGPVATGVFAAQAFNDAKARGESTSKAIAEAGSAASLGVAAMTASPAGQILHAAGSKSGSSALAAVGTALKVAGRIVAPAFAAVGAISGAASDKENRTRGAVRGAIGALDPTAIVTSVGAATGLMSDARGLGERAFDAAFGKAGSGKGSMTGQQASSFQKANAAFETQRSDQAQDPVTAGARGFANPTVQKAAQEARGVQNLTDWAASAPAPVTRKQ